MTEPRGVGGISDIEYDLQGSARAAAARQALFQSVPVRRTRDLLVSSSAGSSAGPRTAIGRAFLARRPPEARRRYEALVWLEGQAPTYHDVDLLISAACLVLEEETDRLLAAPARALADRLAAAVGDGGKGKDRDRAEALTKWGAGVFATTLGLASLVLQGLRRALARNDVVVEEFLAAHFRPAFRELLAANQLAPCLDRLRETYRNPVCHRTRSFDAASYVSFARLLLGHESVAAWEREGPAPCPPPGDAAFLHHLLAGSRLLPDEELSPQAGAVERLSALAAPRASPFAVAVAPTPAAAAGRLRQVLVVPATDEAPFRLGDTICFDVRADRDCHLVLIDVGMTGGLAVLLPNAWCPEPRLPAGETRSIPGPGFGNFAFRLAGRPGQERIIALATTEPLPLSLRPAGSAPFLALDDAKVDELLAAVSRLDATAWACAACEFTIEPFPGAAP